MPEEISDAKETTESSTVETTDAKTAAESSTEATTGAKKETTETPTEVKEPTTMEEAVAQREGKEAVKEEKAEAETTEEPAPAEKDASTEEVPFHEHPRWQQVNKELNEAKPLAERAKKLDAYLEASGLDNKQFSDMLEIGALMNNDPAKALERLRPYVEALEAHQGIRLPDDLKKKVDDGIVDEETAKEVARLRAQKDSEAKRTQLTQEQTVQKEIATAITAWETSMRAKDPDFDKKLDLLLDRFNRLTSVPHERNPQAVVALAEKAYKEVNDRVKAFIPKPPEKKVLTSNGASKTSKSEPATIEEAMAQAGAKYRES